MRRSAMVWPAVIALASLVAPLQALANGEGNTHWYPNGRPGTVKWPTKLGRHGAELSYVRHRDGSIAPQLRGGAGARQAVNPIVAAAAQQGTLAQTSTLGGSWTALGPNPINDGSGGTAGDTGRVLALAYDAPLNKLFLGAADGGVWSSSPGGSWAPMGASSMIALPIGALAIDPKDATGNTIFAGTGETAYAGDSQDGVGVYKSTNGGTSWTLEGQSVFGFDRISAVAVDPTNDQYVYAATVGGFGGTAGPGVAVSTDGGTIWSFPAAGPNSLTGQSVTDLTIDGNGNLYAAVQGAGVYYSNNHGSSWTLDSSGLPGALGDIYKIALAPTTKSLAQGSQVLYAAVSYPTSDPTYSGGLYGVYKTTNGGASWTSTGLSSSNGTVPANFSQGWYDIYVAVSPSTANTVFVGLTDIFGTTNGGTSWTNLTNVYTSPVGNLHPDQHAAVNVPGGTNGTWYFGNDGGVSSSTNNGVSYSYDDVGLALSQFYHGKVGSSGYVLGGLQDNGTVDFNNPGHPWAPSGWEQVQGGDGFDVAISSSSNSTAYGEYTYGSIYQTTNGWSTANNIADGSWSNDAEFSAPFVMDPSNSNTIYLGRTELWKTTNASAATPTWTQIGPSTSAAYITAIGLSKSDSPQTIYAGNDWNGNSDQRGHLFVSTDGGTTFNSADGSSSTTCTASDSSPTYCPGIGNFATDIAVDPTNSQTVYVTVNGYEGAQKDHVFKSTNGGTTWTDLSTSLPDEPFQSIVIDPAKPSTIMAGCDTGAFISLDGGSTWSALGSGLPAVAVFSLATDAAGTTVYAFTHGRGAWSLSIPTSSTNVSVSIRNGWNQIDVPVTGSVATASGLVASMNTTGQLESGAVTIASTYSNGRYNLYVPGYSGDQMLSSTQGVFVLSTVAGTWSVSGGAPSNGSIALSPGWNLVAAPGRAAGETSVTIAAQVSAGCNLEEVATYTSTGYSVWTPTAPTSFAVPTTAGVWMECKATGAWSPV